MVNKRKHAQNNTIHKFAPAAQVCNASTRPYAPDSCFVVLPCATRLQQQLYHRPCKACLLDADL
eukprot:4105209-Amphidinium_carterae.1